MSIQVSYKKQITFFIVLIFIVLGAVELSSRIYEYVVPSCMFLNADATKHIDFKLKEAICNQSKYVKIIESPVSHYEPNQSLTTININSLGFRGSDFEIIKDPNTYRIFMVGGSTTFGSGATSDDKTIPAYLQYEFQKNNYNVEVINAGVGAAGSLEEAYKIRHMYKQFDPDLFLIYDGFNDSFRILTEGNYDPTTTRSEKINSQKSDFHLFIRDYLQEYRTPYVLFPIISYSNIALTMTDKIYEKNSVIWSERWNEVCKENNVEGIKTIIIIQPIVGTGEKILSPDEQRLANGIRETVMQKQLEYHSKYLPIESCTSSIDARNTLDGVDIPIYYDEGHMVDFGYELVAKEIYEKILPIVIKDIKK